MSTIGVHGRDSLPGRCDRLDVPVTGVCRRQLAVISHHVRQQTTVVAMGYGHCATATPELSWSFKCVVILLASPRCPCCVALEMCVLSCLSNFWELIIVLSNLYLYR